MSTVPQTTQNKIQPVNSSGNLAAIINPVQFRELTEKHDKVIQIATLLHTSLSVEEIVAQFSEEISDEIRHDHLSYINEKLDINVELGDTARHSLTYELSINEQHLGLLSLTRNDKFSNPEIEQLEHLICALHYPLRNAVLYTGAVNSAHKDPLTGIGNRAAMNTALHREIELASRHNRSVGIILLDVDHFKSINDTYGHAAGDCCLQSLVQCAEKSVRISDSLFRFGGEEFVIILPETDESGVLRLAKRLRRRVERLETIYQQHVIRMTISLGITTLRETDDEKTLFTRVDEALYQAKQEGRNCIRIATDHGE
jgi:diguanylate cyclase (GGDEF)-like protein